MAKATRTYVLQQQADPSKMIAVEITILDSAENAALLEKFSDPANPQKLVVDSMPAIRAPAAGETDRLELLAFNRFLITVAIKGETTAKGEEWIKRINLPALRTAASTCGTFDPKKEFVFTVERIDEIDTRRTRSSKCSIAPEEEEPIVNSP